MCEVGKNKIFLPKGCPKKTDKIYFKHPQYTDMTFKEWFNNNHKNADPLTISNIDCSYNMLTSLQGLEDLVNLRRLYCSNNQITSLQGIEGLVKLEALYYYSNDMTSLQGIESLLNLKVLLCSNNKLNDLNAYMPVLYLPNLKDLYFDGQYQDIAGFKKRLKYISNIHNLLR